MRCMVQIAALIVVAAVASTAAASDSKYYSATFCRATFDAGEDPPTNAGYFFEGDVRNRGLEPLTLVCPIFRDNTQNNDGWDSIEVGHFDTSVPENIECSAHSHGFDGSHVWSESASSSGTTPVGQWEPLVLNDPAAIGTVEGYYFIRCTVPPRAVGAPASSGSGIAYYRIQEP